MSRDDAIRLATAFANANGYRVAPSFDGLTWDDDAPLPVKFDAARWIDGKWCAVFERMLHPEVECESPGVIIINVSGDGECEFFDAL